MLTLIKENGSTIKSWLGECLISDCVCVCSKDQAEMDPADMEDVEEVEEEETGEDNSKGITMNSFVPSHLLCNEVDQ